MSTTIPTPAAVAARIKPKHVTAVVTEVTAATPAPVITPEERLLLAVFGAEVPLHAKVTAGQRVVPNIIKAVHVQPGITVRSWINGAARGGRHQIDSVQHGDGTVLISFHNSTHPAQEYKAAYRFYVVDDLGLELRYDTTITEPALVPYREV